MAYLISYRHHSVSRAPVVAVTGKTLKHAKRIAVQTFGSGYLEHELTIHELQNGTPVLVAYKRNSHHKWTQLL